MIEQRVTLRYGAQQIPAIVQAVQGDTGRDVIFELADYEIPAGATANYYIDKPDGNAVYNSAEVISSTEILAHLTEQALASPGRNNGQVRILADGEVITSFDFVLEVEVFRGLMRMQSETEVNIFDEALQDAAEDAIAEIQAQTPVVTGMQNSIAPTYSSSSTYAVGDYVMYNAQLYKCNTAITTAEAWTAAHWTQVPLANDVNDLKQNFNESLNFNNASEKIVITNTATGSKRFFFPIKTGESVKITTVGGWANVGTIDENGNYVTRDFYLTANTTQTLTAVGDSVQVELYAKAGTFTFENLSKEIPQLKPYVQYSTDYILTKPQPNKRTFSTELMVIDNCYVQASTGNIVASNEFKVSDFIPVKNEKKIGLSRGVAQSAFYDENKEYVSGITIVSSAHDYKEYDIPSDAYYIRISFDKFYHDADKEYITLTNGKEMPFDNYIIVGKDATLIPEFTTMRGAVEYAVQFPSAKVYVKQGDYNLLTEFSTEISQSKNSQYGLGLGNGIHIFAEPNVHINCLYTGSDNTVITNLSPFYALSDVDGGFTLENVEIHSSNCRYCVHDEYSGSDVLVRNIYKNCKMYHNDRGAGDLLGYYPQCIGGGCAKHTYVDIEGCYFYSKVAETEDTPLVSYHNSSAPNSKSNINVSNSYFANMGTFECSYYGDTTLESEAIVNNCSVGASPYVRSQVGTWPENFKLLSYNNTVRA